MTVSHEDHEDVTALAVRVERLEDLIREAVEYSAACKPPGWAKRARQLVPENDGKAA